MLMRDGEGNLFIGDALKFAEEPGRPDLRLPAQDEHGAEIRAWVAGR
jgi:hypothetical protein